MTKKYHDLSGGILGGMVVAELGYDPESPVPPTEFQILDPKRIEVEYRCPSCGYGWCGAPIGVKVEVEDE